MDAFPAQKVPRCRKLASDSCHEEARCCPQCTETARALAQQSVETDRTQTVDLAAHRNLDQAKDSDV